MPTMRGGHAAGDVLIQHAADALRQAARSVDIVARLGGDEFSMLSAEYDQAGAEALLKRVRKAVRCKRRGFDWSCHAEPSIGLEGAMEKVDQRMYEEKRSKTKP